MQERDMNYVAEFFSERVADKLVARPHSLVWSYYRGKEPMSRECTLWIPFRGSRAARSCIEILSAHLGVQREIPIPPGRSNIWMGRRMAPAKLSTEYWGYGGQEDRWTVSIWSNPGLELPVVDSIPAEEIAEAEEAREWETTDWQETGSFMDAEIDPLIESENDLKERAAKIARLAQEANSHDQLYLSPLLGESESKFPHLYVLVHGYSLQYRATQFFKTAVKEFPILNSFALIELSDEDRIRGWQGKYAVVLAENVFTTFSSE